MSGTARYGSARQPQQKAIMPRLAGAVRGLSVAYRRKHINSMLYWPPQAAVWAISFCAGERFLPESSLTRACECPVPCRTSRAACFSSPFSEAWDT